MTATYSPSSSSNKNRVRLIIFDTDIPENAIFQDEEINAFLNLQGDDVLLGAAMALDTMASRESMVQKVIRLMDLQTNGPAVAADLRKHASMLREQVEIGAVDVAEFVNNKFQHQERLWKQQQRGVL